MKKTFKLGRGWEYYRKCLAGKVLNDPEPDDRTELEFKPSDVKVVFCINFPLSCGDVKLGKTPVFLSLPMHSNAVVNSTWP